jgi:RNA-directed DNA polymerase
VAKSARCVNTKDFNLADICGTDKTVSTQALIVKLNRVIKGWANYFSSVVSKQIFSQLDHLLG